ncbi:MAG: lysine exporter LysO family protein [Eubacteriales bacterium]|nr:lysine exporter LysO family protein [Eubacteriales bacterium]MDD3073170.1 lysine exporter LysO family protein [Eubacteriales bacterium]MDD4078335.1 lysine exporter LysO family protein [Eubacteriales bacterium]MDD4768488.1 lysine exporter LysO family protein [Eubacteriales bacterium]
MWMIIIPLVGGYILAAKRPDWAAKLPVAALSNVSLILLLMVMGARLGADSQVVSQLGSLGGRALFMAGATVLGSIFVLCLLGLVLPKFRIEAEENNRQLAKGPAGYRLTLILLGAVVAGFVLGLTVAKGMLPILTEAATWVLGLLLLGVGLDLGGASQVFASLRKLGLAIIFIPIGIVAGSILGGVFTALIWDLPWQEGAAVASGFGWYSLSSVLISEIHSPLLGALAFLSNVFRELIAVIITPLVARWLGPVPAVAPAGATAMDVLLPIISRGAGREYAPLAFFTGAVLSLAVPVFVNLFLSL